MLSRRKNMTFADKRNLLKSHLIEKHLCFIDFIEDNQFEMAKNLFEDPFEKERGEDKQI